MGTARYYMATVLGAMGRWEESLDLHRENLAENPTGSFLLCRVGEALAALGRYQEALGYLQRALGKHEQELRVDTASLFNRLAVLEDRGRICQTLASLRRPDAPVACASVTAFAEGIKVEPTHAFPRAFLATAWTNMGKAYEVLSRGKAGSPSDRQSFRTATLDRHRRSYEIWADLKARGLVSPVDTGRVSAAERAVTRAQRLATLSSGAEVK